MKRAAHKAIGVTLLVGAAFLGCFPPTPSHPEYVDRLCGAACDRRAACDSRDERASCLSRCRDSGPRRRVYYRADVVEREASCFGALECPIAMDDKASQKQCVSDVDRAAQPTAAALAYCNERVKKTFDCGPQETSTQCLDKVRVFTDEVIHELGDCLSHSCGHFRRCDAAVVGYEVGEEGPGRGRGRSR